MEVESFRIRLMCSQMELANLFIELRTFQMDLTCFQIEPMKPQRKLISRWKRLDCLKFEMALSKVEKK